MKWHGLRFYQNESSGFEKNQISFDVIISLNEKTKKKKEDTVKKIFIASVLAVGLAVGGFAYAHGGGYSMRTPDGNTYAMMGGGGGYGMMGGNGGYGMMGGNGGGNGMMDGSGGGYGSMGNGNGHGRYNGNNNYQGQNRSSRNSWTNEQNQKFLDDTVQLRKELNDKRFEYREAQRNPNASKEQLAKLEREINNLQTELNQKAQQYR